MKINYRKIFVFVSIIFISSMVIIYGYRFIHYYKEEHQVDNKTYTMIEYLTKKENLIYNKFSKKNDIYYYPVDADNNYLFFSGLMYRIIYIDNDKMLAVADNNVTSLKYGITQSYDSSNIKKWLEDIYLKNIDCSYLVDNDNLILDKETYSELVSANSFILGEDFWIIDDDTGLIATKDGNLQKPNNYEIFLGIKPVITLNGNSEYVSGKGTKKNPYIIENRNIINVSDLFVGEYIDYKDKVYRIIEKNDYGVKVLSTNKLDNMYIYSSTSNKYNLTDVKGLGYYLNNEYIKELDLNDLVKSKWYIGEYHFDYNETLSSSLNAYVGILKIGDYFITDVPNSFILSTSGNYTYTISNDKLLTLKSYKKELDVYPSFVLKSDLNILGGSGFIDEPYVVGD